MAKTHIYAIATEQEAEEGIYKVGEADDVEARRAQLQTGNSKKQIIYGVWDSHGVSDHAVRAYLAERGMHRAGDGGTEYCQLPNVQVVAGAINVLAFPQAPRHEPAFAVSTNVQPRPHQLDALNSIRPLLTGGKGRVVIPTGGGKTLVEALIAGEVMLSKQSGIHIILAPRIALANQLLNEYRKHINTDYMTVAFHSGDDLDKYNLGDCFHGIENGTDPMIVGKQWLLAQARGKHLLVFSTYHSCHKLTRLNFDLLIADESQYCVQENFHKSVDALNAKTKLFFTATEKYIVDHKGNAIGSLGLNNKAVFGERVYEIAPKELINRNIIVAPRLHTMWASVAQANADDIVDTVAKMALVQDFVMRKEGMPGTKILFACERAADADEVGDRADELRAIMPKHDVFTITSKGKARINNKSVSRPTWMSKLAECDNAVICHYDILAEGIDIDGITGVCILRDLNMTKAMQTIGRALRVYKADPALKKFALISVPVINGDAQDRQSLGALIRNIREGGFEVTADILVTKRGGVHDDDTEPGESKPRDFVDETTMNLALENIIHEIEGKEEYTNLLAAMCEQDDDEFYAELLK